MKSLFFSGIAVTMVINSITLAYPAASADEDPWDSYSYEIYRVPHFDSESIQIHWVPSPDRQWMNANVTWRLNVALEDDVAVIVRLVASSLCGQNEAGFHSLSRWLSCDMEPSPSTMLPSDIVTRAGFALFQDVQFDTKYYFRIGLKFDENSWQFCEEKTSPGCDDTIYGNEHCSQPCNPVTEPPSDLNVDSVISSNVSSLATISWLCPPQHDGTVEEYYVVFNNLVDNSTAYFSVEKPEFSVGEEASTRRIQTSLGDLVLYDKYEILVVPIVQNSVNQSEMGPFERLELTLEPLIPTSTGKTPDSSKNPTDVPWQSRDPSKAHFLVGVFVVIGAFAILSAAFVFGRRLRKHHGSIGNYINAEFSHELSEVQPNVYQPSRSLVAGHEFPRSRLHIQNELGRGNFGIVYKAVAIGIGRDNQDKTVAVKMLKDHATALQKDEILHEITTLQEIGKHPNILGILGCCTAEEPYFLITEYLEYGDLLNFLWRSKETGYQNIDPTYVLTEMDFYRIARQIARGMEFLALNKYVHGDLAARNVLVGEDLLIKISDFGLTNDVYLQGWTALPTTRVRAAKWVSLETNLNGLCTIQSDVWSFGIVLYEIATQGEAPYNGMSATQVVAAVKDGYRMPRPAECPESMYAIMNQCWLENPDDRPTFTRLLEKLDGQLEQFVDYINESTLQRSSEEIPHLVNAMTDELDESVVLMNREYSKNISRQSTRDSAVESAFCGSTSRSSFDEYPTNGNIEDFSDGIVFDSDSESDTDEGFSV